MLRYLRTVRREINILVVASAAILLLKILWLNSVPSLFYTAAELGEIVDRLCASILSSYVFFLIVVHLKSEKDKETVNPYIANRVRRIVGDCQALLVEFQKASGILLALETLTDADIDAAFMKINPNGSAPLLLDWGKPANWFQFMNLRRIRSVQAIEKLFRQVTFLDAKLVQLLANIDECSHFIRIEMDANRPITNMNMDAWASTFFDYCVLARKLSEYEKSKLASFHAGL